jgi:glutaredoxin 3
MIEIWSKPNCPFCDKAENLCIQKNLNFKKYMLDVDFSREELFEKFPTARTFPQITNRWGFNWWLYRILCKNT